MVILLFFASLFANLELEVGVNGERPFYPGQRLTFIYKITYSGDITLKEERLPLFDAEGFEKIGGLEVKDIAPGVRIIQQLVKTLGPGETVIPASSLEGKNALGETVTASVASFILAVRPFPKEKKPFSFTGAVGSYHLEGKLISSNSIDFGDIFRLELLLTGEGNIGDIQLPNILCQPGFSGRFSLPAAPLATTNDGTKTFQVTLKPETHFMAEIPPIAFSSFDVEKRTYRTTKTDPLKITVEAPSLPAQPQTFSKQVYKQESLPKVDVQEPSLSSIWSWLLVIPIGIALTNVQLPKRQVPICTYHQGVNKLKALDTESSLALLKKWQARYYGPEFFDLKQFLDEVNREEFNRES